MDTGSGVFVDPEEDEIFFFDITERERQLRDILGGKSAVLGTKTIPGNSSEETEHTSEAAETISNTLKSVYKLNTDANLEKIMDLKWSHEETKTNELTSEPDMKVQEPFIEKSAALGSEDEMNQGTITYLENGENKMNGEPQSIQKATAKEKLHQYYEFIQGENNVCIDHNYSTPLKSVIDKNILKTPISIVKADKDGGFLKALSEIAIVKAEADENTLKESLIVADALPGKELINDDNKENKQCDSELGNSIIKATEIPSSKLNQGLTMKKASSDGFKKTMVISYNDKMNGEPQSIQKATAKEKLHQYCEFIQGENNVCIDHNYSIPLKSVIDKNILKTPISIVKADKDGGFLKALSEIAIVKAEADENTLKESLMVADALPGKELVNDDNKENKQCDSELGNSIIKATEIPSSKLHQGLTMKKASSDGFKKTMVMSSVEKSSNITAGEQNVAIDKIHLPIELVTDRQDSSAQTKIIKEENSDTLNELEVLFERLNTKLDDSVKPCELYNIDKKFPSDSENKQVNNLIGVLPDGEMKHNMDIKQLKANMEKADSETTEKENFLDIKSSAFSGDKVHKKCLKRKTMRLLEELNEIISKEEVQRDSSSGRISIKLSEEAAKVIEGLKKAGIDDSISSPDEYFDLDKLSNTFPSAKFSDILNDTLSKPLCDFTDKDVELLLEKITSNTLESNFQVKTQSDELCDAEKENVRQGTVNEYVTDTTVQPVKQPQQTPDFKRNDVGMFGSSSSVIKSKVQGSIKSVQLKTTNKPNSYSSSEAKRLVKNVPGQMQVHQNRLKGIQSSEKKAVTRIPKLTATTSKIPVNSAKVAKVPYGNPTPSKINKLTPLTKVQKSLKMSHIKSPVQAYIHSKTPVLISNVKGKTGSGFDTSRKQGESTMKSVKVEAVNKCKKNEPKSNLPFVKYKSAIPLKLEVTPESRLPRLTPKMQKLIERNSPIVMKHEGRLLFGACKLPRTTAKEKNDDAIANEVSVLVSKVAQKTNFNN